MDIYGLHITFRAAPQSSFFTRELDHRSIRVRKAKSPGEAQQIAQDLQSAFQAHALPDDVVDRLKKKLI